MSLSTASLIERIQTAPTAVEFADVIATIDQDYAYSPSRFTNGAGETQVINEAGQNAGSCKIFAFAQLHGLSQDETLACFGHFYRDDVLQHPDGCDHMNIRNFMQHGWAGIHFDQAALSAK